MPGGTQPDSLIQFLNPEGVPYALALILGAVLLARTLDRLLNRLAERSVRYRLLTKQLKALLIFMTYVVAVAMAVSNVVRLSSEAVFALSGTLAVTVGFAFKDLAASFMAGITILTNKPFQVGDRITFEGYYGEVRDIGLRTVRLVTLDDNLVTIPSNKFLTELVASANAGALDCMVVMPFYICPDADHNRAREIVRDAVLASKYLYLGKPSVVLVSNRLTHEGIVVVELTAKAYVYDAQFEKAFASDVTDRVLQVFRTEGIPMPGRGPALVAGAA